MILGTPVGTGCTHPAQARGGRVAAMASGADAGRSDAGGGDKGRCLKCAYPVGTERNVLAVINRFKEMLQHVGYLTGRLVMDEAAAGAISISITLRPVPRATPSGAKAVEETPAGPPRPLALGTSSCCSTNSLCKAHACRHREEASKPAQAAVRVPAAEIQYPGSDQPEPAQYGSDPPAGSMAGENRLDRQTQAQTGRQAQLQVYADKGQVYSDKGAAPPGGVVLHQPQQKMDGAEQSGMHRLQTAGGNIPLLAQQHMNAQKQHGSSHQDDGQLRGNSMAQGPHVGILNSGVVEGHNDKSGGLSKKQNVQLGGQGHMRDGERQVHQDQTMVPAQQSRLHWGTSADRLGTPVELPFQRSIQGRNFPRQAHNNQRAMQHAQGHHGIQQASDGLTHEMARGLPSDLQIMDQSPDGYGQITLTDDHMHGSSGTVTPVQRRLQMQQVSQPDQWAIPSRGDNVIGSNERDTEGNRLTSAGMASDEARSVGAGSLNRRIDYGAVRAGQSPPAKRARIPHSGGNTNGMSRLPNEGGSGGGVQVNAGAGGMDLQASGLVNAGAVGLQTGGLMNAGMVNTGPVGDACQCEQCGKTLTSDAELQKHQMKEHRTPAARNEHGRYPCTVPGCEQSFVRRHVMERHVRTVHLKIREFPCDACGRKFADSSTREVHRSAVHEKKKPWNCDICLSTFTQSSSLGKHKRRFHGDGKQKAAASSLGNDG